MSVPTYIHGNAASQVVDTSGEILDIKGVDISSLVGGAFNYEHKSDLPAQIVGKILEAKKIFSEQDCENEHHLLFWNLCGAPYLYVMGRLFDDKKESSKEIAAVFLDDAEHPSELPMFGFSIEGSKINKEGMVITHSIARKITITHNPANKSCLARILETGSDTKADPIDDIFKAEYGTKISLKKTESLAAKPNPQHHANLLGISPARDPKSLQKTFHKDWAASKGAGTSGPTINFEHRQHGTVTIHQNPQTLSYEVKHNGAHANLKGVKAIFHTPRQALGHAKSYMGAVSGGTVIPKAMTDSSSGATTDSKMHKALEAGSGMAAPGQLVGGAALGKEKIKKKMVVLSSPEVKKSEKLESAELCYQNWKHVEAFENFIATRRPDLTRSEAMVLGQVLALKSDLDLESELAKLILI